ncbi:AAA family ATPase [Conexibacter stalactiti]|uniref:AAA family ATPase n=1 Tax=Conexibacter stalactiti TaxID=1940611 RepID=A0ABU4HIJ8_9ACTN|nr:AAA family ATPase [Conexibacter stalactiti]MDW5593143.1 AAA family ATPase [Conexibacter stalactiti]MEC5033784.1 AAA family ATPase [Conexibacter stalactiti]
MLRGRRDECAALDRLLQRVRVGQSAVLALRGDAGIGKTALLEYVAEQATTCHVVRVVGVQAEMELAFAGLHQLCAPMQDGMDTLPEPQEQALRVAFGLQEGGAPNRFLVALGALGLLAGAAERGPLVCLIDDAQWLDRASAQVLAFVARRLLAERIAIVFAVREPSDAAEFAGLPELRVGGLADPDARALLESAVPGRVDTRVRDRILAETRGNPLALLELPRGLTPAQLAGGFGLPDARPLSSRIEQSFLERVRALSPDTQRLLLAAAAEPLGDANLLWRAADRLGIGTEASGPAEAAGLIVFRAHARFTHPLVRSAVYRGAEPRERRDVHAALAESTDPELDPDGRAWHHAHATATPDEAVAAELVRSADRARRRSGLAAAAAFLQRATELTPDPVMRVERALDAAQAKLDVADAASASDLLAAAELGPIGPLQRARLERLRAQIAFNRQRGRDAPPLLLAAAERLDPLDAAMARETYLEALGSATFAGRLGAGPGVRDVAEAARASNRAQAPGAADPLLDALATRYTDGYAASVAPLREALRAFRDPGGGDDERWLWLACRFAQDLWDDELWHELATHGVHVARETGALNLLPIMTNFLAALNVHSGAFATAAALVDEVDVLTQTTGLPPLKYAACMLAAARGDQAQAQPLFDYGWQNATERGEGSALGLLSWLTALLHNANGRYGEALTAAQQACEHEDVMSYGWALVELVEAAVRSGRPDAAAAALDRLSERTQAAGTEWALGVEARCRALVDADEARYRESIERLARSRAAVELARSRLLYGEWLRREHRRADARELLRGAHADFSRFGAAAFAERARRELLATGETVRSGAADLRDALTPQEVQVARLAREGHTNPEIGAQLFISPRTVEYHLRKVFRKLDVNSRRELRDAFEEQFA